MEIRLVMDRYRHAILEYRESQNDVWQEVEIHEKPPNPETGEHEPHDLPAVDVIRGRKHER